MIFPYTHFQPPFCSARFRQYNLILNIFEIHTHTLIEVQFRLYLDFNRLFLTVTKKLDFSIDGEYQFVFIWKQYTVIVMPFIWNLQIRKKYSFIIYLIIVSWNWICWWECHMSVPDRLEFTTLATKTKHS